MYVGKYRPKYPALHIRLRSQLRRQFDNETNLALHLDLDTSLYRALLAKSYVSLLQ